MAYRARPGDIVSRRKGFVMHRGVALGDGRVLHNTPFKGEHICSEAEFRDGKRLYVNSLEREDRHRALSRASAARRRGYNLLTNNCEHTVTRATQGRAESPQLRSWVVGSGFAVAAFAVTRHPVVAAAAYAFGRKLAGRRKTSGGR
ncbi:MAG: hypothetical protein ACI9ON_002568 [Limisphaerales bacterium]|jgi:hypothetical protein